MGCRLKACSYTAQVSQWGNDAALSVAEPVEDVSLTRAAPTGADERPGAHPTAKSFTVEAMPEEIPPSTYDAQADDPLTPNWYVLLLGLTLPARSLILAPGVSLIPLPGPLSIFDLAAAGAAGFSAWALIGQIAPGCTCELESARDSDITPGYDTLNRAWLASSLLVLRGHGAVMPVACSAYPWSTVAELRKQQAGWFMTALKERGMTDALYGKGGVLPRFKGNILDFHTQVLQLPTFRREAPTEEDAEWCRGHFDKFNQLCADSDKFRFALEAAIDWRYAKDHRAAISRLWAGIESLFGVSAELVYRLSVYSAALLSPRGAGRTAMYERVKKLYSVRSKAVHGDKVTDDKLTQGAAESFELLRSLLLLAIDRGRVPTEGDINQALFE